MSEETTIISDVEAEEVQDRLLLSTVQKIKKLSPIPGKDRVEKVEFESVGFTAIVEKGLHAEGDLVVFTKYDSVVADIAPFDWMKDMKFRVKPKSFTIKEDDVVVGKIYSQGIVVKLKAVEDYLYENGWRSYDHPDVDGPFFFNEKVDNVDFAMLEGRDLTLILGTKKYIAPTKPGSGLGNMQAKGTFPTHIVSKTDEDNLASRIKYLEKFKGKHCVARMKMEGSSLTGYTDPATIMAGNGPTEEDVNICSRNNNLKEIEGNKFWSAANKNNLKEVLVKNPMAIIQGELMGPGIQNNKLQLSEPDLYVFTITDMHTKYRFEDGELVAFCKANNLKVAPLVGVWDSFDLTFDQLQEIADNLEYLPGVPAEGLVLRTYVPEMDGHGNWLSVKVINRNYTL